MKKYATNLIKLLFVELFLITGLVSAQNESVEKILNSDGTIKIGQDGLYYANDYTLVYGENNEPKLMKVDKLSKEKGSSTVSWTNFSSGTGHWVYAVAKSGNGDVYAGGSFTSPGFYIAKWNGSSWSMMGSVDNSVYAIAVSGNDVYIGGDFIWSGQTMLNRIAKWNGSSWSALGNGVNGTVRAIAISGGNVYVGGSFTLAGGNSANNIAKWNGSSWSAIGSGVGSTVNAIAISGTGDIYVGGAFTTAGGNTANYIAKWNSFTGWSSLDYGLNNTVNALAISGSDMYVGGNFTSAGGMSAKYIAKWNSITGWASLGYGANNGTNTNVNAISVAGSDIYVGGAFTTAGGNTANYIAKWNATNGWSTLVDGSYIGVNSVVYALKVDSTAKRMIVGGAFTSTGSKNANRIASFTDSDNPFPVELTTFTATAIGNHVNLYWTTASEFNNYGFYIERKINDEDWQELTFIEGCGNSQVTKEYTYQDKIETSGMIKYRLKQVDLDGGCKYSSIVEVEMNMPIKYSLSQNYPNPFNPETTINYSIPKASDVKIVIYDVMGKEVATLIDEKQEAGNYSVKYNARNLTSGVYFYKIETSDFRDVKKMVLIK
jgi:hypothetical protein